MKSCACYIYFLLMVSAGAIAAGLPAGAAEDITGLQNLLRLAEKSPDEAGPKDHIYFKHDIVYCTGESSLAVENNKAAANMESGDFAGAAEVLERALKNSALFFPFRYNLGTCFISAS